MTGLSNFPPSTGRPALDLCNTRLGEKDLLGRPADLERWFVAAGLTDHAPRVSRRELEAAQMLRDGLRPALLEADGPRVADLAEGWLGRAPGRLRVEPETLRPRFDPAQRTSCCLLVDAVLDALDLVRESPGRVRECADPRCPVLFLDTSRNGSRRWCSMERCGARAKASAYYRRHRAVPGAPDL
jgi:predicted RNA-binding Zn ribbon-like protein